MLSIAMYLAPLTTVLAVLQVVSAVFRARFATWVLLRKSLSGNHVGWAVSQMRGPGDLTDLLRQAASGT